MNPNLNATLSALRYLLVVLGGVLAEQGLGASPAYKWIMLASGSIMVVGPAIWGVWAAVDNWWKAAAVGTQSGMNLVLSGKALASDGKTLISTITPGSTPTKPVTIATTQEIVKDFAPETPIEKT